MQTLLKTLLFCSTFTCFAGYAPSLLAQEVVGEYEERIPPAIMPPMKIPLHSIKGEASSAESANHQQVLLGWPAYGEYGNLALGSRMRSVRPMTNAISKSTVRAIVRALKRTKSVQSSSIFTLHLPPEHLMDADFIAELKALLPNCSFAPDTAAPWRELSREYYHTQKNLKRDSEKQGP